jgi:hypothetical protein
MVLLSDSAVPSRMIVVGRSYLRNIEITQYCEIRQVEEFHTPQVGLLVERRGCITSPVLTIRRSPQ